MPEPIKTYVLIGHNMHDVRGTYANQPNCYFIEATPGVAFEDALQAITPPANIVIACHGIAKREFFHIGWDMEIKNTIRDGYFEWHEGEEVSYAALYAALPKGVTYTFPQDGPPIDPSTSILERFHASPKQRRTEHTPSYAEYALNIPSISPQTACVLIAACYGGGGITEQFLRSLPPGTLVFSDVSATNASLSMQRDFAATESMYLKNPIDLYLESLDNSDSAAYAATLEFMNREEGIAQDANFEHALAHVIGIGGNPPVRIDLNDEIRNLCTRKTALDRDAWKRSIARVQKRFDSYCGHPDANFVHYTAANTFSAAIYPEDPSLDRSIDAIANKITRGHLPAGAGEKRIAFALAATYLEESGKLQNLINQTLRETIANSPLHQKVDPSVLREARAMKESVIFNQAPAPSEAPPTTMPGLPSRRPHTDPHEGAQNPTAPSAPSPGLPSRRPSTSR